MFNLNMTEQQKQRYRKEIAIREVERPIEHNIEKDIEWICECLGLADNKNDLAAGIFKELLRATKEREGITTREIVEKEKPGRNITQGAIVYHLNIFIQRGVVIKQGRRYYLRSSRLDETIDEIEQDMIRRMKKMRELAKHIDEEFEQMMKDI